MFTLKQSSYPKIYGGGMKKNHLKERENAKNDLVFAFFAPFVVCELKVHLACIKTSSLSFAIRHFD